MINDFEVELELDEFLSSLADDAISHLAKNSPNNTGKYAKGWKKKKVKNGYIIYQEKDRASITHLLENGHLAKNLDWVSAQPHILSTEQNIERNIENKTKLIKIVTK